MKKIERIIICILIIANLSLLCGCGNGGSKNEGTVVYGIITDWYDDDGDGWVDRSYDKILRKWNYADHRHITQVQ